MDMYTHLWNWIHILEGELGRPLENSDYLFPYISQNGVINPKQPMTHDVVSALLSEFTLGAGIDKHFTTHSLRRGGAQYRFMFCPIGQRWSLSRIRWWRGWAEGESVSQPEQHLSTDAEITPQVDTLIKYLVDSLHSLETSHADALNPMGVDMSETYLGEGELMKPATRADIHFLAQSVLSGPSHTPTIASVVAHTTGQGLGPPDSTLCAVTRHNQTMATQEVRGVGARTQPAPVAAARKASSLKPAPIPGVRIPDLKQGKHVWQDAVRQWEEGDQNQGVLALRDWPEAWYTGEMRLLFASKRRMRQVIAEEYDR